MSISPVGYPKVKVAIFKISFNTVEIEYLQGQILRRVWLIFNEDDVVNIDSKIITVRYKRTDNNDVA